MTRNTTPQPMSPTDPNAAFSGLTHRNAEISGILDRLRILQPQEIATRDPKERMLPLLEKLGNTHLKLPPVIHIAGTNGKGSVLAYLQAVFEAAGHPVHKFTSPHLVHFNERIVTAGKDIDDPLLKESLTAAETAINGQEIRFFDAITLAAFYAFARIPADVLLLETGMGGRLDSTNIFDAPLCTALSAVSLDHTSVLGNTHEEIARTKSGIAKPDIPFLIGAQENSSVYDIASREAAARGAVPLCAGRDWMVSEENGLIKFSGTAHQWQMPRPAMAGTFQIQNAGLALAMLEQIALGKKFYFTEQALTAGLQNAKWRGRLQRITAGPELAHLPENAALWLDGGHNASAAQMLASEIQKWDKPADVILALSRKRDFREILTPLYKAARSITLVPLENYEQALYDLADLQALIAETDFKTGFAPSWREALRSLAPQAENILIAGSLYLAGDVLKEHG
ncbi:MAG: bifunctional folylpolyglutamate synthase/dihydrofolate synthase [Micavibrio sp.]|nr:MAG: bifunctional folylpolyglutamate synthase/dihydrofolate synthase [Micavibrio sp.]